jgi:mannose-1-phosphate guanylyltransferase/mannose-1-phosphate guanylyltransferase/phosphomannomutase
MVMAAGLGTRLRPITHEIPKPVVPVCNRPIVEHLVRLLAKHGVHEVIANPHWFPDTVESALRGAGDLGVEMSYRHEEELLGTAGGVRNVADFLSGGDDDVFLVLAGDALTDADLTKLADAHRANGGVATLGVTKVADVSEYGVIITDSDGRVQGFQEKPDPAEALSDLVNCMVYAFSPEIFDYFPADDPVDFALDLFPALLENGVPFHVHDLGTYWNDIGTLREYVTGNLDALEGSVSLDLGGELLAEGDGDYSVEGRVLAGDGVEIGAGAELTGPLVIGPGARIGEGAKVKEAVLLAGAEVSAGSFLARGVAGSIAELPANG